MMEIARRQKARNLIVVGYSVIFVGTLINVVWQVSSSVFQQSWRTDVNTLSTVFASFTAIIAWWFLSRIIANKPDQLSLIRKAYLGLSLQALLLSASVVVYLISYPNASLASASAWGFCLGTITTAIGFFMMALSYPSSSVASGDVVSADP